MTQCYWLSKRRTEFKVSYCSKRIIILQPHYSSSLSTLRHSLQTNTVSPRKIQEWEEGRQQNWRVSSTIFPLFILSHFPLAWSFPWTGGKIGFVVWIKPIHWDYNFWQHVIVLNIWKSEYNININMPFFSVSLLFSLYTALCSIRDAEIYWYFGLVSKNVNSLKELRLFRSLL